MMMDRRDFLATAILGAMAAPLASGCGSQSRRPKILLRNAWQSQNIGDIAHYIGMFELMERYKIHPAADVTLWPSNIKNGADQLIRKNFPWVELATTPDAQREALSECDFVIHGSAAWLAVRDEITNWINLRKPFGVFGISVGDIDQPLVDTLNQAEFAFVRDSVSLRRAIDAGCSSESVQFGLDTAFGMTKTRNDAVALKYLRSQGLEDGKFLCCIPRLRVTPLWEVEGGSHPFNADAEARNQAMKEHDHAPLRAAITALIRETGMKVLVACEDQTQIKLGKEMLVDPLPEDVKANVVWRDHYWLPDEALSVYARSAGLFGNEMHSPILCVTNGIPAVVCRFKDIGNKGFMWRDIGLDDWLFDLDNPEDIARIVPTVLDIAKNPLAAEAKVGEARNFIRKTQDSNFEVLWDSLK